MGWLGAVASLAATGYSAYSAREERKESKKAQEDFAAEQARLEQEARDAEAQAEFDAKEAIKIRINDRKRANTWKTRDIEEDKLGVIKTALGRQ